MNEVWKDINGYEGLYKISSLGRVKSLNYKRTGKERILKLDIDGKGYIQVVLCKNGRGKMHRVHRLVAQAFIPNPDNLPCINHRDECKTNNIVDNLEFCSYKYNLTYGSRIKRVSEKQINGKASKKVFQYTLNGEFVAEYPSTMEVQRQLGYSQGNISLCCNGKLKTAYGYIWSYIKEPQSN